MEGQMRFWLVAVPLLVSSALAARIETYVKVGGSLKLVPPETFTPPITSVVWKHRSNLMAEWVKDRLPLNYFPIYNTRTTMNITNGVVEVRHVDESFSGIYEVTINSLVQSTVYDVRVIPEVPVPVVELKPLSCASGSEQCSLLCYVADAKDAGPVTYSWKKDGEQLKETTEVINITSDEETQRVKAFTCLVRNPVSEKQSEAKPNPFYQHVEPYNPTGLIVGLFLLLALVGVAVWKRLYIVKLINNCKGKTPSPGTTNAKRDDPEVENPLKK